MYNEHCLLIHHPLSEQYRFHREHPFDPVRYSITLDLLRQIGALTEKQLLQPQQIAADSLLQLAHHTEYIDVIKGLSQTSVQQQYVDYADQYGLHTDDTPYFQYMHQAAAGIVEGTVAAVQAVMSGRTNHAFHMAGGLHHAFEGRAAGFCIYNDAVVAIKQIQKQYNARVLYIDTDVHHGDGVQLAFYSDPSVCTYSIHETGKFLFPGTGFQYEKGHDQAYGTCFNMPLEPFTEDESFLESFNCTLKKVVEHYKPDIIISQHGCDAHAFDPLSHLQCSMTIYREIPRIIHQLAHQYTEGKWVALGGGGYDIWRVVPRAWSLVWLEMIDHPLCETLRSAQPNAALPPKWLERWEAVAADPLPSAWLDAEGQIESSPRQEAIAAKNREIAAIVIQDL